MIRTLTCLAVIALAGCQPVAENNEVPEANTAPTAPAQSEVPEASIVTLPNAPIPAAMHGRWGLVPADCTSQRGDAKGLLTIGPEGLAFYESRATLAETTERTSGRLAADFNFTGEGQSWRRRMTLSLEDDGRTLVRSEEGEDAIPEPLRYSRCDSMPVTGR